MARFTIVWRGIILFVTVGVCTAQSAPKQPGRPLPLLGPAVSFIYNNGPTNRPLNGPDPQLVLKALCIRLTTTNGVCFDTETLRYISGWSGGFLDVSKTSIAGSPQGSSPVFPDGTKTFSASPDGRTVILRTQPLQPVMQMKVKFSITTADGTSLIQEIDNTIHRTR